MFILKSAICIIFGAVSSLASTPMLHAVRSAPPFHLTNAHAINAETYAPSVDVNKLFQ